MSEEQKKDSEEAPSKVDTSEVMEQTNEDELEAAIQSLNDTLCEGNELPMQNIGKITLDNVVSRTLKTIERFRRSSLKARAIERKNRRLRRQMKDLLEGITGSKCVEDVCIFHQMKEAISSKERKRLADNCSEDMSDHGSDV